MSIPELLNLLLTLIPADLHLHRDLKAAIERTDGWNGEPSCVRGERWQLLNQKSVKPRMVDTSRDPTNDQGGTDVDPHRHSDREAQGGKEE